MKTAMKKAEPMKAMKAMKKAMKKAEAMKTSAMKTLKAMKNAEPMKKAMKKAEPMKVMKAIKTLKGDEGPSTRIEQFVGPWRYEGELWVVHSAKCNKQTGEAKIVYCPSGLARNYNMGAVRASPRVGA